MKRPRARAGSTHGEIKFNRERTIFTSTGRRCTVAGIPIDYQRMSSARHT